MTPSSPIAGPVPLADAPHASPSTDAAAAVLDAEMTAHDGGATAQQLAEAERTAGILFDAASVEAAVTAARDQAHAESRAELAELHQQLAVMGGAYRQRQAVLRLAEGRPGDDLLLVSAVAVAAECGTTALDGLPMTLSWTGDVQIRGAHETRRAAIECTTSYGGRAELVIDGDARRALATLLDREAVRDANSPCLTDRCGTVDDYDESDPAIFGWARVEVAGVDGGPRWYCTPMCVANALAQVGSELADIDDQAAADGAL